MDLQFYGANCVSVSHKGTRLVVDDNLGQIGAKSVTRAEDVSLCTMRPKNAPASRLVFDGPGEYEVADISIIGIAARAHMEADEKNRDATMFKLIIGEHSVLFTGHIYPELNETQLEAIGMVDVMLVPVGGNGYTVDPVGALKLIKAIEPKLVIPTHYADKGLKYPVPQQELSAALKEIGMETKETVAKFRLKPAELTDVTQLVVLERS
jgi:L-ascorbate metabolism protein UlaG (beta-lactamase superfamily)